MIILNKLSNTGYNSDIVLYTAHKHFCQTSVSAQINNELLQSIVHLIMKWWNE